MELSQIIPIVFGLVALVNIIASANEKKNKNIIYLTKPLLMPLLISYHVLGSPEVNFWLVGALVGGFFGDVFLMLPGEKEHNFLIGLVSFLINHVLYIVIFVAAILDFGLLPVWLYFCGLPYIVFCFFYYRVLAPGLGEMKIPVIVYIIVILCMGISALLRLPFVTQLSFWLVAGGALVFITSDSVLAYGKFKRELKRGHMVVMATYLAAQFMITQGLMS
jgi:uncharacterized membrane protein YhhN